MRCRKVRSYLSAYCSGELTGRRQVAVGEHLAGCSSCREEEAAFNAVHLAGKHLPGFDLSEDFNTRLLNRIARERFAETRTKAFLPKRAPLVAWGKVVPAVVTACAVVLVGIFAFLPGENNSGNFADAPRTSDDALYLTVQPTNNPNMAVNMNKDWSLSEQMARAERINRITSQITPVGSFGSANYRYRTTGTNVSARRPTAPYVDNFYRVRTVVRVYQSTVSSQPREEKSTY